MEKNTLFFRNKFLKIILLADALFVLIFFILSHNPMIAENAFGRCFYPVNARILGFFSDLFFFSITELMIILFVVILSIRIIIGLIRLIKKDKTIRKLLLNFVEQAFIAVSITVIWFYSVWGFNYYRLPLMTKVKINLKETSREDFEKILKKIINKTNLLYRETSQYEFDFKNINIECNGNIDALVNRIENKKIHPARRMKTSLLSLLELTNTYGVISPFFLEAHYSKELFDEEIPFIITHEKSHLFGYANETECNYLSFVACAGSEDKFIEYSGYSSILKYFLSRYKSMLKEESGAVDSQRQYEEIYLSIAQGVREQYKNQHERDIRHYGFINELSLKIYDIYLKINNVPQGVESYSGVVDYILNSKQARPLIKE